MLIRNKRPWAVEIPNVGEVDKDGTIEVPDELGTSLCEQTENWEPVRAPKSKLADAGEED